MKLSIITINYNNLDGLKKTVDSVLSQTWRDFEWIIVDGGSIDGSKEYIETLAQSLLEGTAIDRVQWNVVRFSLPGFTAEDLKENTFESVPDQSSNRTSPIVHRQSIIANRSQHFLWCSEPDKGIYNAMNKGIVMAQGEFLNFMNSGDCYCESNTLEEVFSQHISCEIFYGDWIRQFKDREVFVEALKDSFERLAYFRNICHQAMFIKTDVQKSHFYDESFRALADLKLWCELPFEGYKFQYIPVTVCRFWAEDGLTSAPGSFERNKPERLRILQSEKIPPAYREWVVNYIKEHEKFAYCEYNMLTSSTYDLIHERRVYRWMIKANILFVKFIKIIIDTFSTTSHTL